MSEEEFPFVLELARKISSGRGFKRSLIEVYLENRGSFDKEVNEVFKGGDIDDDQIDFNLKLLYEASKKEKGRKATVLKLLETYLELKKSQNELKTLLKGVELRVKVMSIALSLTLGCLSILIRSFTTFFREATIHPLNWIPFMLSALIATSYSIKTSTGKWSLKWLVISSFTFLLSLYFLSNLLSSFNLIK